MSEYNKILEDNLQGYEGYVYKVELVGGEYFDGVEDYFKDFVKKGTSFLVKNLQNEDLKIKVEDVEEVEKNNYIYKISVVKVEYDEKKSGHLKGKYEKYVYIENKIHNYINDIGIINAQKAHSEDVEVDKYISLRDFLKANPKDFPKKSLYVKIDDNIYIKYRHKNLFSSFKDEISDFERYTYFERNSEGLLEISYSLDSDILDFDQTLFGLVERKNARNFAKEVFHKKGKFKDQEFLKLLKGQDVYIKVNVVLDKDSKEVYSKINVVDMNIRVLENEFIKSYKNKPERVKNIQKKYLSKRGKKRKIRREKEIFIKEGLGEYYDQ